MKCDELHEMRNRRAMASAEAAWLQEPDEATGECPVRYCLGPNCRTNRHGECPDPGKLADYKYDRREECQS